MSQQEAVSILRTSDYFSEFYSSGATKDGRIFNRLHHEYPLDNLPPSQEIDHCVLTVLDHYGREVEVTFGPGGIVSGKRLSPGVWEYRFDRVYRALRDSKYYIRLSLAAGVLFLFAWILHFWAVRRAASSIALDRSQGHSAEIKS